MAARAEERGRAPSTGEQNVGGGHRDGPGDGLEVAGGATRGGEVPSEVGVDGVAAARADTAEQGAGTAEDEQVAFPEPPDEEYWKEAWGEAPGDAGEGREGVGGAPEGSARGVEGRRRSQKRKNVYSIWGGWSLVTPCPRKRTAGGRRSEVGFSSEFKPGSLVAHTCYYLLFLHHITAAHWLN